VAPPGPDAPEQRARQKIDAALAASGWVVQNRDDMNVSAARGVAVREFKLTKLTSGHAFADYLLFVDGKARVLVSGKTFLEIHVRREATVEERARVLRRWYREQMKAIVPPLVDRWQTILGVHAEVMNRHLPQWRLYRQELNAEPLVHETWSS
jgi:predicted metal-dependent hydrolase